MVSSIITFPRKRCSTHPRTTPVTALPNIPLRYQDSGVSIDAGNDLAARTQGPAVPGGAGGLGSAQFAIIPRHVHFAFCASPSS